MKLRLHRKNYGFWWVVGAGHFDHDPLYFYDYVMGYVTVTGYEKSYPLPKHLADAFFFYVKEHDWGDDWSTEVLR